MATKRKAGLSLEDKRTRMLEIFYEKKDVFQLKDLERIAPKEKGIVMQSVKDVVQSLVDDGLADSEKIGTSIYFWAFPSKSTQCRKSRIETLDAKLKEATKQKEALDEALKAQKSVSDDEGEREAVLLKHREMTEKKQKLLKEIELCKDSDPEVIAAEYRAMKEAAISANRWIDNIDALRTYVKEKFGFDNEDIKNRLGIEATYDYVSETPEEN